MNPTRPSLRCSVLTWAVALLALFLLVACVQPHNPAPTGGGSPLPTPTTVVLPTPAPEVRDSQAWAQTELLGISFKYLNGSVITDTTTPDNQPDDEMRWEHILIAGWDLFFNVGASTGVDASYVADDAYPYNIPSDPGPWRYYFPAQIEVEGATKAWLLVIGARDAETKEWVAVYSELGPYATLNAIVYNETCVASISFESSFDLADTQQVEATSLAQVVTERYPVFDQMVHSVRFPEECTDEQP